MTAGPPDGEQVRRWLTERRSDMVDQLAAWVRIESVAGVPEREGDLRRSAEWLARRCRDLGMPTVEIWDAPDGPPAVFAAWEVTADAPTVLIYSHHDVRAAPAAEWTCCPPFEPLVCGNRLFGRGASDAKGQVLAHLWGLQAYLATEHDCPPPVNVKFLVEGEEETGSPHLAALLGQRADRLRADLVVFSDTMTWGSEQPALCTGVRGLVKARLEIRGALRDIHAGAVAGAAVNPAGELVRVLAGLHDPDGRVTIPGFYDAVEQPADDEVAALARLTVDESDWRHRSAIGGSRCEPGRSVGEQLYTRPAVEVLMLAAGDREPPTTGTMPAVAAADIHISLVPRQDPDLIGAQLRQWVAERLGPGVDFTLSIDDTISQPAYRTPSDHPALAAMTEAMAEAWGMPVGRMRNAGSGPTLLLTEAAQAPVVFFGTGLPEDGWHGPDESIDLDVLIKGAATLALFWPRLRWQMGPPAA